MRLLLLFLMLSGTVRGQLLWEQTYGAPNNRHSLTAIAQLSADTLVAVGFRDNLRTRQADPFMVRFYLDGESLEESLYPVSGSNGKAQQVWVDDRYIHLFIVVDYHSLLHLRTDRAGREVDRHTYYIDQEVRLNSVAPDGQGGFYLGGLTSDGRTARFTVLRLDAAHALRWVRKFDNTGNGSSSCRIVRRFSDGSVFAAGQNGGNLAVYRIDADNEILWGRAVTTPLGDRLRIANAWITATDAVQLGASLSLSGVGRSGMRLHTLDADGNLQWQRRYSVGDPLTGEPSLHLVHWCADTSAGQTIAFVQYGQQQWKYHLGATGDPIDSIEVSSLPVKVSPRTDGRLWYDPALGYAYATDKLNRSRIMTYPATLDNRTTHYYDHRLPDSYELPVSIDPVGDNHYGALIGHYGSGSLSHLLFDARTGRLVDSFNFETDFQLRFMGQYYRGNEQFIYHQSWATGNHVYRTAIGLDDSRLSVGRDTLKAPDGDSFSSQCDAVELENGHFLIHNPYRYWIYDESFVFVYTDSMPTTSAGVFSRDAAVYAAAGGGWVRFLANSADYLELEQYDALGVPEKKVRYPIPDSFYQIVHLPYRDQLPGQIAILLGQHHAGGVRLYRYVFDRQTLALLPTATRHRYEIPVAPRDEIDFDRLRMLPTGDALFTSYRGDVFWCTPNGGLRGHYDTLVDWLGMIGADASDHLLVMNVAWQNEQTDLLIQKWGLENGSGRTDTLTALHVYPNPARYQINATWEDDLIGPAEVVIHDAAGRVVARRWIDKRGRRQSVAVDVRDRQPGLYYLEIRRGVRRAGAPFVVTR